MLLLLHAEPAPHLPAAAWLGRLSAAPPSAAFSSAVAADLKKKLLNVRWNTHLGATGAADAGAGVGAGARAGPGRGAGGAGGPSPLVAVQPPTKLYFRQTRKPQSL